MKSQYLELCTSSAKYGTGTDVWYTPQATYDALHAEFGFTVDTCALPENAKCANYFTPEQDGLKQEWRGMCWCNPPYSKLREWIIKAREAAQGGQRWSC